MSVAERAERQQPVAQLQQQIQFKKLWRLGRLLSGTFLLRAAFRARLKTIRPLFTTPERFSARLGLRPPRGGIFLNNTKLLCPPADVRDRLA